MEIDSILLFLCNEHNQEISARSRLGILGSETINGLVSIHSYAQLIQLWMEKEQITSERIAVLVQKLIEINDQLREERVSQFDLPHQKGPDHSENDLQVYGQRIIPLIHTLQSMIDEVKELGTEELTNDLNSDLNSLLESPIRAVNHILPIFECVTNPNFEFPDYIVEWANKEDMLRRKAHQGDASALPDLHAALASPSAEIRSRAINMLDNVHNEESIALLKQALQDADERVSSEARWVLAHIGK